MANATAVGTFNKETSDVDNTNQAVSWGSPSFTPNFLVIWTGGKTAIGTIGTDGVEYSQGFTDGTTPFSVTVANEDGVGDMNCSRRFSETKILRVIDDAGALIAEAEFVSFDSSGFTIKWTTSSAVATKIHFKAIEATNVDVVVGTAKTTTGAQTVSHAAFTGNALIAMGTKQLTADTDEDDLMIHLGFATAAAEEVSLTAYCDDAGATDSNERRGISSAATITMFSDGDGTVDSVADFTSFASGSFDLNWSDAAVSAWKIGYAILELDNAKVGVATNPASTGTENTITGTGFTGNGIFTATVQTSSSNTGDGVMGFGAADGESTENNAFTGFYGQDANTTSNIGIATDDSQCMRMTLHSLADRATGAVTAYGSGTVEFNWSVVSGQRDFAYLVYDAQASAAPGGTDGAGMYRHLQNLGVYA